MPTLQPRPHQAECLEIIKDRNTIVNMPTGTGKTLVAVLTINHFVKEGKVIFVVPTRPLVSQQAEYVRNQAERHVAVKELSGDKTDYSADEWREVVEHNDVLVGTAEIFRRALVAKFLDIGKFSLLIFDECHNATGNNPMAGIMKDCVHRIADPSSAPRILGLTASFVNGNLKDIEEKRKTLEGLLQSRIFAPAVEERPMEFEYVAYDASVVSGMQDVVTEKVERLLGFAKEWGVPLQETTSVTKRAIHVFSELGKNGFIFFLRECVAHQVKAKLEQVAENTEGAQKDGIRKALQEISTLRDKMREAAERLSADEALTDFPLVTDKARKLLDLVAKIQGECEGSEPTRVIVFAEQTVLAFPLAHLLKERTKLNVGTCTGVGSMTDGQRKEVLSNFKAGNVPILTCTAALEEGLDVSECRVVIRFSPFTTTKSHIQGSGRARATNAKVYYFNNNPGRENAKAALVDKTAKATGLSLTDQQMQEKRQQKDIEGLHPFRSESGAEISVYTCVQIVNEFVSKALGQSIKPEESMITYADSVVCEFPLQKIRRIVEIKVPSPEGEFSVTEDNVSEFWGELDVDDVAEKSRMKNWTTKDKEKRRFFYIAAVQLSKRGFLDSSFQPTSVALRDTKKACGAWQMSPAASINVRYNPNALNSGSQAAAEGGFGMPPGLESGFRMPPGLEITPQEAGGTQDALAPAANFKGQLNEIFPGQKLQYETVGGKTEFSCTVTLPDGRTFQSGNPSVSKKAAEQLAAQAACCALRGDSSPSPGSDNGSAVVRLVPGAQLDATPSNGSVTADVGAATNPSVDTVQAKATIRPDRAAETSENFKGKLIERYPGIPLKFETNNEGMEFRSTVTLPDGRNFQGMHLSSSKKAAEQLAAQVAWDAISAEARPAPERKAPNENYKGQLNERFPSGARYDTVAAAGGGYISTVSLPDGRQVPGAASAATKKEAEQLAAHAALALL